jgi:ribose-phosphate pyrophosphokinase
LKPVLTSIMKTGPKFFSGSVDQTLAKEIAQAYGSGLGQSQLVRFSDGELQPVLEETVRGFDVFLIQSTVPPADNLLELLLMVDAAKRASADNVVAVIPYFGMARQDRKDKPRVSIGSKLVANLLSAAGVTRVMTMDLHADQIQGFFDVPVDHLYASSIFAPHMQSFGIPAEDLVVASPDIGGSKRANAYSKFLGCGMVMLYKERVQANQIQSMTLIGDVKGKHVILVDDMCDTAGTLTKAANIMADNGAASVRAYCTHGILSGNAIEKIQDSALHRFITTNTVPQTKPFEKLEVLSVAPLFGEVIRKLMNDESISSSFLF